MSLDDDLTAVQRCLDELARAVKRIEPRLCGPGGGPDLRRVRADTAHLRESVALLCETAAPAVGRQRGPEVVPVPDTPYDSSLWTGAEGLDDEGLGAHGRHAP
ncbi:hypothetical protein [Streptomyces beihaiensis]|uniref:Uncharacterized protein n=1 Tax=Streptomyces beihaiensis TaxID=2984495 RepID=A0ABT3TVE8_9ACTN|nr:hypothetical protein [Streptomyces beihaiensis]MCX3061024.1 hypothetical protein [Streptomyces beihaiensis]